jgi:hypothetical protein
VEVVYILIYHIFGSDYAEFAWSDIGDVSITQSAVQKMHINISMHAKNAYQ